MHNKLNKLLDKYTYFISTLKKIHILLYSEYFILFLHMNFIEPHLNLKIAFQIVNYKKKNFLCNM